MRAATRTAAALTGPSDQVATSRGRCSIVGPDRAGCRARAQPLYRRKLAAAGLNAGSVRTPDDLRRVPFTSEQELPWVPLAAPVRESVRAHLRMPAGADRLYKHTVSIVSSFMLSCAANPLGALAARSSAQPSTSLSYSA